MASAEPVPTAFAKRGAHLTIVGRNNEKTETVLDDRTH
jgi:hypothetical protein